MAFLGRKSLQTISVVEGKEKEKVESYAINSICTKFDLVREAPQESICLKDRYYGFYYSAYVDFVTAVVDESGKLSYLVKVAMDSCIQLNDTTLFEDGEPIFSLLVIVNTSRQLESNGWTSGRIVGSEIIGEDYRDTYFEHRHRKPENRQHTLINHVDTYIDLNKSREKIRRALNTESRGIVNNLVDFDAYCLEGGKYGYPYELVVAECTNNDKLLLVIICADKDNLVYSLVDKDSYTYNFGITDVTNFHIINMY